MIQYTLLINQEREERDMIQRILKKDIRRRKSVNIILFLFVTIASVFLSSSINNILVVFSAVDYYMDYANVPEQSHLNMKQ